jgi:TolB-like protein
MTSAPDIFLSYNREDQARAKLFAEAFERQGLKVWWDVGLRTGEAYDEVTETALRTAKAVVVLWSKKSVQSRWVRAEATLADRNKTLVPCMIEPCERPIMFELPQTAELGHWDGAPTDKAWVAFLDDVLRFIGRSETAPSPAPPSGSARASPPSATVGSRIVVLPFRARANDDLEQVTAEGLTDDVTTLLTSVRTLNVAPRTSLRRTLEPNDNVIQIAKDLSCRYAVTGSVRRSGDKLRVSVELIDVNENQQKWSQRFDRPAEDIFAIQDEIAKGVVVAVGGVITRVESARALREHPDSLQAWELTRRAMSVAWDWRPETLRQGMLDARKALEYDPNYALAHAWLANILAWRAATGWSVEVDIERLEAIREADEAVRLGYDNAEALWPAQMAYWAAGSPHRAVELYERTIARQADFFLAFPFSMGGAGVSYARVGRVDEGLALIRQFESAFPNDEWGAVWTRVFVGYSELCRGNYARVTEVLVNPPSEHDGMCRVVALMCLGRDDEAKEQFHRLKGANPAIALDHFIAYFADYSADRSIGAELSEGLARLRDLLAGDAR